MGARGQSVPGARSRGTHLRGCAWRWGHARGRDLGSGQSCATNFWGGRRLGHVGGTGGLRSPVKAGTTQVGDPGGWAAPGQERGVALSSAGAPFYSYQVEGLSHFGGSWAFLVADRDPLGAGPSQLGEWEWGPVGVARGGWAALWGQRALFPSTLQVAACVRVRTPWGRAVPVWVGLWEAWWEALVPGPVGLGAPSWSMTGVPGSSGNPAQRRRSPRRRRAAASRNLGASRASRRARCRVRSSRSQLSSKGPGSSSPSSRRTAGATYGSATSPGSQGPVGGRVWAGLGAEGGS